MPEEVLFLLQSQARRSQRDQELQDAVRRSHAAKVSHARRLHGVHSHHTKKRKRKDGQTDAYADEDLTEPPMMNLELPRIDSALTIRLKSARDLGQSYHRIQLLDFGHGNIDPFNTSAMPNLPSFMRRATEMALDAVAPSFVPSLATKEISSWLRRMTLMNPPQASAGLVAATSLVLKDPTVTNPTHIKLAIQLRRKYRASVLNWIAESINNASGPPSPLLIHLVMVLIVADTRREVRTYTGYPQSILTTAQFNHVNGGTNFLHQDVTFWKELVDLAGGPDVFRFPLLKGVLEYLNVLTATRFMRKPFWPLSEETVFSINIQDDHETSRLGTGFGELNAQLMRSLSKCSTATAGVYLYQHNLPGAPSWGQLVSLRCETQHALLSANVEDVWEELILTAALLFSDIMLFVLPPEAGSRKHLVMRLMMLLITTNQTRPVWIWSLMLGSAAAATMFDNDSWWPCTIRRHCFDWAETKEVVKQFLWYDSVLDPPVHDVWMRAFS